MNQPASSQKPVRSGQDSSAADAADRTTGLDQTSLRQAIHDLRGSLNTMSVQLDVALTRIREGARNDGSFGAQLAVFGGEIRRLDRMLRQLAEAGETLAERLEPVDLRVLLTEVFAETRTLARAVTINLELPPEGDLLVVASAPKLRRALSTAARRSFEAMPDGGTIAI